MSKKSLMTPNDRRSMLGFGSAAAKLQQQKRVPEQKRLTFSANRSRLQASSVGGKRWSSQGAHQAKDNRPLSNRAYQKQMIEEILEFLNESGYPHQISVKVLSSPTSKEFLRVFEHLYGNINSSFKMDKKYEEEVPRILKSLHYPFTISKSAMFSIGSLHSWPSLLGALHWLVILIRSVNSIDAEQLLFPLSFEEDGGSQQRMFFEYFSKTYLEFMTGNDDFKEAQKALESAIISQAGCSEDDHEALKDEVAAMEEELSLLESESDPLEEALRIKSALEETRQQDEMRIKDQKQKCDVLKQQYTHLRGQIHGEGIDLDQLGDPKRQEDIKHKSLEVKMKLDRLNGEKERLEQQNCEREMRYSKLHDKFAPLVDKYNDIARELALNPVIKQYLGEDSIALNFDHNQKDLSSLDDWKNRLKPLLVKLASKVAEDRYQLEAQKIIEEENLDRITETCAEKEYELSQLKTQVMSIDKELDSHKEFLDQEHQIAAEKLCEREDYLEEKRREITQVLDDETKESKLHQLKVEDIKSRMKKEQSELATALVEYCKRIKEHQTYIENRIGKFNALLIHQLDSEDRIKEKMKKIYEE